MLCGNHLLVGGLAHFRVRLPARHAVRVLGAMLGQGLGAGEHFVALLGDDHPAFARLEAGDQAELAFRPAHLIPRQPEAIGMAELRLAVVLGQLLGEIDELLFRRAVAAVGIGFVEGEHGQGAVDLHRGAAVLTRIEHHPAAEPAHAGQARLREDVVGPDVDHARGRRGLAVVLGTEELVAEVQRGAAAQRAEAERAEEDEGKERFAV